MLRRPERLFRLAHGGLLSAALAFVPALLQTAADAEAPTTRPVSGDEMQAIQNYSRGLGKDLIKESLGIDLDQWQLQWNAKTSEWNAGARVATGSPGGASGPPGASGEDWVSGFRLKLEQTDDLQRLLLDQRDLPFGLELSGAFSLWEHAPYFQTRVWLPLSWRDELRANASVPIDLFGVTRSGWWQRSGLGQTLSFRSDYRNRLGLSQMQAGLGTLWLPFETAGLWHLDYDYHLLFGQGSDEAIHWLKISRPF